MHNIDVQVKKSRIISFKCVIITLLKGSKFEPEDRMHRKKRERKKRKRDWPQTIYMEHWGVTLLLLYRAIACFAAPL